MNQKEISTPKIDAIFNYLFRSTLAGQSECGPKLSENFKAKNPLKSRYIKTTAFSPGRKCLCILNK